VDRNGKHLLIACLFYLLFILQLAAMDYLRRTFIERFILAMAWVFLHIFLMVYIGEEVRKRREKNGDSMVDSES